MLEEVLEALVRRATEVDGGADLARARDLFHARTGAFEPGEPWYEARIRFFLDWYLCAFTSDDGTSPGERVASSPLEHAVARACRRAARGLYEVLETDGGLMRIADHLGGARFRVAHGTGPVERLRVGDLFDGHLVALDEHILVLPGPIFHPPETHEPIALILARVRSEGGPEREALLDALLRMRMRLDRFTSMRARHVYRWEALAERDILSASWARRRESDRPMARE